MATDYYSHTRPEVRSLVPATVRHVIDVGCGAGALGAAIKSERPGVEVRGVEIHEEAAARARAVLDDVAVMHGAEELPPTWPVPDCLIFADVLEHMIDPWDALRRWRWRVREDGCIVVSVPNVACSQVLRGLWRGRWDYEDEGILDRTHLRFFTRTTALELVTGTGFEVEAVYRVIQARSHSLADRLLWPLARIALKLEQNAIRVPGRMLWILDAYTRQFVVRARPAAASRPRAEQSA